LYIAIGLLCGTLLTDKQVGGVCGAALTNICAWLSGVWFDLELLGEGFKSVCDVLPFASAVSAARAAVCGDFAGMARPLLIVCAYAAVVMAAAIFVFHRRMKAGRL
ncbi:MAG: ABC transporter permease, partial [Candidatus Faecivicinus sp.]